MGISLGKLRLSRVTAFFRSFTAERWAALGAIAAAVSAGLSYWQIKTTTSERMTPYRAVLYSAKVASFTDFAKGGSRFDAALHDAHSALAFDVGAPGALDVMPDSQMKLAAKSVHFLMDFKSDYFSVLSAAAAVWSPDTQNYIEQDYIRAIDASRCFIDLGQRTGDLVPVNWKRVRERAKDSCLGVLGGLRIDCFERAHAETIEKMKRR